MRRENLASRMPAREPPRGEQQQQPLRGVVVVFAKVARGLLFEAGSAAAAETLPVIATR